MSEDNFGWWPPTDPKPTCWLEAVALAFKPRIGQVVTPEMISAALTDAEAAWPAERSQSWEAAPLTEAVEQIISETTEAFCRARAACPNIVGASKENVRGWFDVFYQRVFQVKRAHEPHDLAPPPGYREACRRTLEEHARNGEDHLQRKIAAGTLANIHKQMVEEARQAKDAGNSFGAWRIAQDCLASMRRLADAQDYAPPFDMADLQREFPTPGAESLMAGGAVDDREHIAFLEAPPLTEEDVDRIVASVRQEKAIEARIEEARRLRSMGDISQAQMIADECVKAMRQMATATRNVELSVVARNLEFEFFGNGALVNKAFDLDRESFPASHAGLCRSWTCQASGSVAKDAGQIASRPFHDTVISRARHDEAFRNALLEEARQAKAARRVFEAQQLAQDCITALTLKANEGQDEGAAMEARDLEREFFPEGYAGSSQFWACPAHEFDTPERRCKHCGVDLVQWLLVGAPDAVQRIAVMPEPREPVEEESPLSKPLWEHWRGQTMRRGMEDAVKEKQAEQARQKSADAVNRAIQHRGSS
jgi:hypothetical protein